jgi:hypothetical protein
VLLRLDSRRAKLLGMFHRIKSHREAIRAEARLVFLAKGGQPTKQDVEEAIRTKFGGILTSILIALAVKLAWALICKWWEDRQTTATIPESYQAGEPGYGED